MCLCTHVHVLITYVCKYKCLFTAAFLHKWRKKKTQRYSLQHIYMYMYVHCLLFRRCYVASMKKSARSSQVHTCRCIPYFRLEKPFDRFKTWPVYLNYLSGLVGSAPCSHVSWWSRVPIPLVAAHPFCLKLADYLECFHLAYFALKCYIYMYKGTCICTWHLWAVFTRGEL